MASEVDKFVDRMVSRGVTHMHVDWGDDAANLTPGERAKALNDVDDWLSVPANNLASRLEGRAMLLADSARCTLTRFNCKTLEYEPASRAEEVRAKDQERFAELLREAATFIKATVA